MGKSTVIPFGPQHPVLPEPIHLDLELQDEKVVRAVPSIGYVHRGLEKLVELRDFQQYVYVAERVCGICSFGHGWGYSRAVEEMMEIEVPPHVGREQLNAGIKGGRGGHNDGQQGGIKRIDVLEMHQMGVFTHQFAHHVKRKDEHKRNERQQQMHIGEKRDKL